MKICRYYCLSFNLTKWTFIAYILKIIPEASGAGLHLLEPSQGWGPLGWSAWKWKNVPGRAPWIFASFQCPSLPSPRWRSPGALATWCKGHRVASSLVGAPGPLPQCWKGDQPEEIWGCDWRGRTGRRGHSSSLSSWGLHHFLIRHKIVFLHWFWGFP